MVVATAKLKKRSYVMSDWDMGMGGGGDKVHEEFKPTALVMVIDPYLDNLGRS